MTVALKCGHDARDVDLIVKPGGKKLAWCASEACLKYVPLGPASKMWMPEEEEHAHAVPALDGRPERLP